MRLIAILGSSGSGKSALAHTIAKEKGCEIFSLDSLGIYKGLDVIAAKPTNEEQREVRYYALNHLAPDEPSNALLFKTLLESAIASAEQNRAKALLIVGGSSFFLKSFIEGLSPMPELEEAMAWVSTLGSLGECYARLQEIDPLHASSLSPSDTYRIHKALALYKASGLPPSEYFSTHPKQPFAYPMELFCLTREREELRGRILRRSEAMLANGAIDEVRAVLDGYGEEACALKAIGAKECLGFLKGEIDSEAKLLEQIYFHTCQLAKRQATFNRTQFQNLAHLNALELEQKLREIL